MNFLNYCRDLRIVCHVRNNQFVRWQHQNADDWEIRRQETICRSTGLQSPLTAKQLHGAVQYEACHQIFEIGLQNPNRLNENILHTKLGDCRDVQQQVHKTHIEHEPESVEECGTLFQVDLFEGIWSPSKNRKPSDDDFLGLIEFLYSVADVH